MLGEDLRGLAKDFIAQQVPELVVQLFEFINVNHDHRKRCAIAVRAFQFFCDTQFKESAVEDAGESVKISELFRPLEMASILDGGGANVCHRLQRLNVSSIKGVSFGAVKRKHSKLFAVEDQRHAHF